MTPPVLPVVLYLLASGPVQDPFHQDVSYRIEARLNAKERLLTGHSTIRYGNNSPDALSELVLHLYPNRYKDRFSTAAREQAFYHDETIRRIPAVDRGYLDVERVVADGEPVPFRVLDTVLRLQLPAPLLPGAAVTLELEWFEKVRAYVDRGGWRGRHFEFGHWFPEIAVYDSSGWHDEPAHDLGDPSGEFADFDVTLTVPQDYVVAASGELVEGDAGWQGARERSAQPRRRAELEQERRGEPLEIGAAGSRKQLRFRAEAVNDFAWVADPLYLCEEAQVQGTMLRVLYRPSSRDAWQGRVIERVRSALEWLHERIGPYPYPSVTVAEALSEEGAGYPMLVMSGTARESSLVLMLGQLYYHGVLGNDRIGAAWLNEGFAAFQARRYLTARYGPAGESPEGLDLYQRRLRRTPARDAAALSVLGAARYGMDEPVATAAHQFRDRSNFLPAVRHKGSLFLDLLEHVLGTERFDQAMRSYYSRWRLRHVDEGALRAALESASGADLGELFESWLHTTRLADYSLGGIRPRHAGNGWDVAVGVRRRGAPANAVDLVVRGEDGSEQRLSWDAGAERATLALQLDGRPELVWLDPEGISLDPDRHDNRRPRRFELVFGWPFQEYHPRDAYVLSWRPSTWYNAVDGLRAGVVIQGSQDGALDRLKIAPSIGARTGRADLEVAYATPLPRLGRTEVAASAMRTEGRRRLQGLLRTNLSPRWDRRPQTRFEVGFSSFELTDAAYQRPNRYDEGTVNQLWMRYGGAYAGPGWESDAYVQYQVAGRQFSSDFSFNRLSLALTARTTRSRVRWMLRGFLGLSSDGDVLPRQERFYLGGAGPLAELESPGLRSQDSLLTNLNYHVPGEGNIRAYNGFPVSARRLFAINLEAEKRLLGEHQAEWLQKRLGRLSLAAFGDIGKAEGTGVSKLSNPLFGVGFGLRLQRRVYGRDLHFRLDFPFYANRPGFDEDGIREERTESRWLISFSPAL